MGRAPGNFWSEICNLEVDLSSREPWTTERCQLVIEEAAPTRPASFHVAASITQKGSVQTSRPGSMWLARDRQADRRAWRASWPGPWNVGKDRGRNVAVKISGDDISLCLFIVAACVMLK